MHRGDREPADPATNGRPLRVFLSVAGPDVAWGEWIYRQLREDGHEVEFYKRSFPIGANFVASIDAALARADRMVAVLAPGYCDPESWVTAEWQAALQIARRRPGFLVPLLVEPCELTPLLAGLNHVDLVDTDETTAAARIRHAVATHARLSDDGDDGDAAFPGRTVVPGRTVATGDEPAPVRRTSITLLHLPDLVAGGTAGSATSGSAMSGSAAAAGAPFGAALRDDLDRFTSDEGAKPDLVVVSGVAVTGRKAEYAQATELLASLAGHLELPRQRVVIVPGRGDVNAASCRTYFAACEEDETEPVRPFWRKWRHFVDFFDGFYRAAPGAGAGVAAPTFAVGQEWTLFTMPDLALAVAGLNSTTAMSHRPEDDHGEVGDVQAAWFADRLADYERRGWFRIAVGHHPPVADGGFDTRTLRDANAVDLALGRHLNLLVAGYGDDSAVPAPARLRHSGTPVVCCRPRRDGVLPDRDTSKPPAGRQGGRQGGNAAAKTVRYQILRVDRHGLTRWDRRFGDRAGGWRPDGRGGRDGPTGTASTPLRWQSATAAFPRETPRSGRPGRADGVERERDDGAEELGGRVVDRFADRVTQVTQLRYRDGQTTLVEGAGDVPTYLRVTVADGPVVEQHPVGVHEAGPDMEVVDAFVGGVHNAYAAMDQQLVSDLVYGGAPAHPSLVRYAQERGVRLRSFVEYQGLLDLRDYVRRQTATLAADRLYPPALYLPQRYRLLDDEPGEVRDDLLGRVVEWLTSDAARFVLLLGDFGRGKTFILHELARRLPDLRPHLVPVLVDLRRMEKSHTVDELVASHLVASGEDRFDVRAFRYMLRSGRIVLLFDGFDELALRVTYETAAEHLARLLDAVDGQAKIVVTSRTQHFLSHGQVRGALGTRVELLPASKLAEIEDFTDEQVREFLVRLYGGDSARAANRLELIHNIRDLLGLSRNPRMLGFIAALDESTLRAAQSGRGSITSVDLYQALIDSWLRYEEERARPRGSAPTLTAAERLNAVTALALRLWQTTDRLVSMNELASTTSAVLTSLSERGLDESHAAHMIGSGSLLVRTDDGAFTFIHQSVMEYLVAVAAATTDHGFEDGTEDGTAELGGAGTAGTDVLSASVMSPLMVDFFRGAAGVSRARTWARGVLGNPEATGAGRLNAIAVARTTDRLATRGARLTGAVLKGVDFSDLDLAGADLTGADLSEARFVRTTLSGALLRGARLAGARFQDATLVDADLTDADLTDARIFGSDLTGASVTGSAWTRTALIQPTLDDSTATSAELASASVLGRDSVRPLVDPAGPACAAAYSPDGATLAYGIGSAVVLVDATTGVRTATLTGHGSRVWSVSFSPDGRELATGSDDRTCRIWDVATGTTTQVLDLYARRQSIAFLPDRRRMAIGGDGETIRRLDVTTGATTSTVTGPTGFALSFASSPDGRLLATGGDDGSVRLWDVATSTETMLLTGHSDIIGAMAFSPDGATLATGSEDGTVRLWDVRDGHDGHDRHDRHETVHVFNQQVHVLAVAFSPDGKHLAIGCKDRTLRLWNVATETWTAVPTGHLDWIWTVAFSPDSRRLVTGSGDGSVRQWEVASSTSTHVLTSRTDWVWAVAFSPDGNQVAAGGDGTVWLWDMKTGTQTTALTGHTGPVRAAEFSPDGTELAAGGGDGTVRLWDMKTGTQTTVLTGHTDSLLFLSYSPDNARLATGSGATVRTWEKRRESPSEVLEVSDEAILTVAFSPDGDRLAMGGTRGTVLLWQIGTDTRTTLPKEHSGAIRSVRFSPDGLYLASCGDTTIRLWDTATGSQRNVLTGHLGSIRTIAFSPDGAWLASGGVDATIRIWDPLTGKSTATLVGHIGTVRSVAFSPDGRRLASGADDGTMRIWDLPQATEIATFTNFREGGWAALFPDDSYKLEGDPAGALWWSIKQCGFEPGVLDRYVSGIRRLARDAPIPPPPPAPT